MEQFINRFLKHKGVLMVDRISAEEIASLCLPVFFKENVPKELINWNTVESYGEIIFTQNTKKVNNIIYKYLDESKHYNEAWFKDMFNNDFIEEFNKPETEPKLKKLNQKQFISFISKFSLDDKVKMILEIADSTEIDRITLPSHSCGDIEYNLISDDKDHVTFHKKYVPNICDKLEVCDYQTTGKPVYKDWYMTINYHS